MVSGLGFRISCFGFRASGFGLRASGFGLNPDPYTWSPLNPEPGGFGGCQSGGCRHGSQVSDTGLGSRVSGLRHSGFGIQASDFGRNLEPRNRGPWPEWRVQNGFRISGFRFRVSGFSFRVPIFGFQISGSGFRVLSFEFSISSKPLNLKPLTR